MKRCSQPNSPGNRNKSLEHGVVQVAKELSAPNSSQDGSPETLGLVFGVDLLKHPNTISIRELLCAGSIKKPEPPLQLF